MSPHDPSHYGDPNPSRYADPEKEIGNIEAEAALIGALMIDNRLIPLIAERVQDVDFLEPIHGRIFRTIVKLHERGSDTINPITLKPFFDNDVAMASLGGPGYLAQLTGSGVALIGASDFADQIAELAARRRIAAVIKDARDKIADAETPLVEITGGIEDSINQALFRAEPIKAASAAEMVGIVIDRDERIASGETGAGATCRTVGDLTKLFGGLEGGTLIYVAGRPGMGKTVLGVSAAWGFAANGHPTEYFHAEMTREQLSMRLLSDVSHGMGTPIAHAAIRRGGLSSTDRRIADRVAEKVAQLPFRSFPVPDANVKRIESMVARSKLYWERRGRKLEIVVVDYVQLLQADVDGRLITDDRPRVTAVSKALRRMADRHNLVVIGIAQLSRALESRTDKRPQTSDLRDSGTLEQDADGVLLLYREEYYLQHCEPKVGDKGRDEWEIEMNAVRGKIDLILGKWRHGEARTRQAKFFGANYAIRGGDYYPEDQQDLLI